MSDVMERFVEYPKIHALGKDETDGILSHPCVVLTKLDGMNVSVNKNLEIYTRRVHSNDACGFGNFVRENSASLLALMEMLGADRLFFEWLVPHSVIYPKDAYNRAYFLDAFDVDGKPIDIHIARDHAKHFGFDMPAILYVGQVGPTQEEIIRYADTCTIPGSKANEGVVIRSASFTNKYGRNCYAKYVTPKFKESRRQKFGSQEGFGPLTNEMRIAHEYVTKARVQKIMHKYREQQPIEFILDKKATPAIMGLAEYDVWEEHFNEIRKLKGNLDLNQLSILLKNKAREIFHELLDNVWREFPEAEEFEYAIEQTGASRHELLIIAEEAVACAMPTGFWGDK
jgi:hypothetical protein